jgi:hypothetical protein
MDNIQLHTDFSQRCVVDSNALNLQEPFTTGKEPALDESLFADETHSPRETHH